MDRIKCNSCKGESFNDGTELYCPRCYGALISRIKELETEARQRHKLAARFADRKVSQPSADSDLMAANDIKKLEGTQWDRIAKDLTEAKSKNAKLLARVGELEDAIRKHKEIVIQLCAKDLPLPTTDHELYAHLKEEGGKMKGPKMRCPNCSMKLTQVAHWSEKWGVYYKTLCQHCGWEEG